MSALTLIAAAWAFEAVCGWPDWLYRWVRHPVVWIGTLIDALDTRLNQSAYSHATRYALGALSACIIIAITAGAAWLISQALPGTWWGFAIEAVIASSLIASRSLYQHVSALLTPLKRGDVGAARAAVSQIVGRDPAQLDEHGIVRAGLESLAENASDGVVAPVFWGSVLGLPGLAAYKAVNTLDSMIGHRTDRYAAFGGFAARLDDLANLIPARLTGFLFATASLKPTALAVMFRNAGQHRSPNAGWPEAAMAGGLGVRLSGPRVYGNSVQSEPWLNAGARDPEPADLKRGLAVYVRAMGLGGITLISLALGVHYAA